MPPIKQERRTHAQRVAEADRRLLDAAKQLVAERGYTRTTIEGIGALAGYSRGQVSQRFGSKDGLLEALVDKLATDSRARIKTKIGRHIGVKAIHKAIEAYLEGMENPPLEARAYFVLMLESIGPAPQIRPAFAHANTQYRDILVDTLKAGQATGEIHPEIDALVEATLLVATLRGIRLNWMLDPDASPLAPVIKRLKKTVEQRLQDRSCPAPD